MQQETLKNQGFVPDKYDVRKDPRKTYMLAKSKSSLLKQEQGKKINDMADSKIIYAINFGEDAMIIVAKQRILVYSLLTMEVKYARNGFFWDAVFIPDTCCLAVIEHDGTSKSNRTVKILDISIDEIIAQVTISFDIETLKVSKHCIGLGGVTEVAVMHFPTLKPICHEITGTGLNTIFDISYEGLTLAYQCQARGVLIIHNFTQIITNQAKRKQSMSRMSEAPKSQYSSAIKKKMEKTIKVLEINAHKQNISMIKLSPTGARVATASNKGTIIRIFLTASGKLWEELRVGYEICKILDLNYYEEGNVLACLTQKNIVQMYNLKLEPSEQTYEKQKRGYEIYQQKNPKSFFSFLSFFYHDFSHQLPFAFKQLVKPPQKKQKKQDEKQIEKSKKEEKNEQRSSEKQIFMPVVLQEEEQDKPAYIEQRQENNERNISDVNEGQVQEEEMVRKGEKDEKDESLLIPQEIKSSKNERSASSSSFTHGSHKRHSQFSGKILKKNSIMNPKQINFVAKVFNTVHKVYVGGNNFIWAVKGSYLFTLKYDPFNGGEMYHKDTLILHQ